MPTLCVCATANQAVQQWSDVCLESQSREQIKEQLNSTTALGPKPNDGFQEPLKPLTGLASLPSLSWLLFIYFISPFCPYLQPLPSFNLLLAETVWEARADISAVSQARQREWIYKTKFLKISHIKLYGGKEGGEREAFGQCRHLNV